MFIARRPDGDAARPGGLLGGPVGAGARQGGGAHDADGQPTHAPP
jgi:hypothetical protein